VAVTFDEIEAPETGVHLDVNEAIGFRAIGYEGSWQRPSLRSRWR